MSGSSVVQASGASAVAVDRSWTVRIRSGRLASSLTIGAIAAALIAITVSSDGSDLARTQTIGLTLATLVAALGLNLLSGSAGLISLGQGAFFALGAYGTAVLRVDASLPYPVAVVSSLAICALVGTGIALAAARLHGPQLAMVTLVFAVVVHRLLVELPRFGRLAGYPNRADHDSALVPPPRLGGTTFEPPLFAGVVPTAMILIVAVAAVCFALYLNLMQSPWGRSLRALKTSEIMAAHVGVDVGGRKIAASVVASVYGGIGGVLYLFLYGHLQPESFTLFLGVNLLVAVILGGSGTVLGPVVGAVAVAVLSESSALDHIVELQHRVLSESWYLSGEGLVSLIMLLVLLALPRGIWGTLADVVGARRTDHDSRTDAGEAPDTAVRLAPPTTDATEPPLLRVDGYAKRFGGNHAVSDMTLELDRGHVHALIGPNGAGKSTLANLISGIYRSDAGSATLNGDSIHGMRPHTIARLGVGRTFQTPLLDPDQSCLDNVLLGAPSSGRASSWASALHLPSVTRRTREDRARAASLLDVVGLGERHDTPARDLSYGQQRTLEIARVLAGEPQLVIMDEPAAGLTPAERVQLGELIERIRDAGIGVLLVEHHMDLVRRTADRVTCMAEGTTLRSGSVDDVMADARVIDSYLGRPADDDRSEAADGNV